MYLNVEKNVMFLWAKKGLLFQVISNIIVTDYSHLRINYTRIRSLGAVSPYFVAQVKDAKI